MVGTNLHMTMLLTLSYKLEKVNYMYQEFIKAMNMGWSWTI